MVFTLQRIPIATRRDGCSAARPSRTSATCLLTAGSLCSFVTAAHTGADVDFEDPGDRDYNVPAGTCSITAQVEGAGGGQGDANAGPGEGGAVTATFTVTPGETLGVNVGGHGGDDGSPGVNGGGAGGIAHLPIETGGGGGGRSSINRGEQVLIVAGGGGGSGYGSGEGGDGSGAPTPTRHRTRATRCTAVAVAARRPMSRVPAVTAGTGGTLGDGSPGTGGQSMFLTLNGGTGGEGNSAGGGEAGGGGGGGGGGGYVDPGVTNVTTDTGVQSGDGAVYSSPRVPAQCGRIPLVRCERNSARLPHAGDRRSVERGVTDHRRDRHPRPQGRVAVGEERSRISNTVMHPT